MADVGDPRFATPSWQGRYEVTPAEGVTLSSPTVMLTKTNDCQLCGDAEGVVEGVTFATLPEACRPARELRLPVCVSGAGTETVSLEGTVELGEQSATGEVTVPSQQVSVSLPIPESTGSGTLSLPETEATGTANLSSESGTQFPMLVSGEFDEQGELVSAYSMQVVNNTSPLTVSGEVSVTVPEQSVDVEVSVPGTTVEGTASLSPATGETSVTIPAQQLPVTVSGTIATGGLATLTIGVDGSMTCSSGGTVHLDGFSYHICDRWY